MWPAAPRCQGALERSQFSSPARRLGRLEKATAWRPPQSPHGKAAEENSSRAEPGSLPGRPPKEPGARRTAVAPRGTPHCHPLPQGALGWGPQGPALPCGPMSRVAASPLYLLQLHVPGELLYGQGEACSAAAGQPQPPARAAPSRQRPHLAPGSGGCAGARSQTTLSNREGARSQKDTCPTLPARPAVSLHNDLPFFQEGKKKGDFLCELGSHLTHQG